MQKHRHSDELLWQNMPDDADVVRAFFSEDRSRRILVYRRKDNTYSFADQTLEFDEYEQEYWWRGTDNELSFYDGEESVLADIASAVRTLYGFTPDMLGWDETISPLPPIPKEAVAFLYRRQGLQSGGRAFLNAEGTQRLTVYPREDGCFTYITERLHFMDGEEMHHSVRYAVWEQHGSTGGIYADERSALKDASHLLKGMRELLPTQGEIKH